MSSSSLKTEQAYTIFAQSMDRTGYSRGTLAVREGLQAPVPAVDPRPIIAMSDMGMDHGSMGGMDHGSMAGMDQGSMAGMDHSKMAGMDHGHGRHGPQQDGWMGNEGMAGMAAAQCLQPSRPTTHCSCRL
jgi:FtsP/CotA-like multicopper oxidase with cupredoxin domain